MESLIAWNHTPIVIAHGVVRPTYTLLAGGMPKGKTPEEWYGKLWRPIKAVIGKAPLTERRDIQTFPEDNLMDLRDKITIATEVPLYRQHIYTLDNKDRPQHPYSIFTDSPVAVDVRSIVSVDVAKGVVSTGANTESVLGLPVDRALYAARDYLQINAGDTFTLLSEWLPTGGVVHLADLRTWTGGVVGQLADAASDKYMMELIYWGFIAKYWPTMTLDVFSVYAVGEGGIRSAFPLVAPSMTELRRKYATEREIVGRKYELAHKARTMHTRVAITQLTAVVQSLSVNLNIRNIFELSRVSADIPYITAYIDAGDGRRVRLVRALYDAPPIEPPNAPTFMTGIVYAIRLSSRYLWLALHQTGRYYMRSTWGEDDEIGFGDIYQILAESVSPIIQSVNKMGRLGFNTGSAISPLTTDTVQYQGLNVSVFWKHPESVETFRVIRAAWDGHTEAGIAVIRPTTLYDRVDLTFRKGIHQFDPAKINQVVTMTGGELHNQYAYLSSPVIAKRWTQNYGGRNVSITMREADLRVDVVDIREDEFWGSFYDYIFAHLWTVTHSEAYRGAESSGVVSNRRVRRLRDADPALYNMGKYGFDRKYSQICQGPRQPVIYTDAEVSAMSDRKARALVKYWNFTKGKPAWYGCPQSAFPHMSFVTKIHPAGFCLPCCNKRVRADEAHSICMREHEYTEDTGSTQHILAYGKTIPTGRLSHLHAQLATMFSGCYLASAESPSTPVPEWRILHAVAAALGLTADSLSGKIAPAVSDAWSTLGDAVAGRDAESLVREMTVGPRAAGVAWTEIIALAVQAVYGICVIVLEDMYDTVNVRVPQAVADLGTAGKRYLFVSLTVSHAYPVVRADPAEYEGEIGTAWEFGQDSPQIHAIMRSAAGATTRHMDLAAVGRAGLTVLRKFVNLHNVCYAVMVDAGEGEQAYLSITYSSHSADGIPVDTAGLDTAAVNLPFSALQRVLERFTGVTIVGTITALGGTRAVQIHADGATLYCYFTGNSANNVGYANNLVDISLPYDPTAITRAILSRKRSDRSAAIGAEQYRMSIYNIILMHLGELLDRERDSAMREKIIAAAKTPEQLLRLGLSARDIGVIRSTLQFTGIKGLIRRLDAPFDFDRVTLRRIQAEDRATAISTVRGLLRQVTVSGKAPTVPFPNVYTLCGHDSKQPFCDGCKVVVEDLESVLPVIVDDLRNPLRAAVVFAEAWSSNIMDRMKFTRYGNDRVIVYNV